MNLKKTFLVLSTLFILLGSNLAVSVLATSGDVVPNGSGDSSIANPSGETSKPSGETPTPSGETVTPSKELLSTANDSKFTIKKGETLKSSMEATVSGDETFKYVVITSTKNGVLKHSDESKPDFSYMPSGDFTGKDSFTFRLESGDKYSNVGTVSITIEDNTPVIPFNYKDMQNHWANFSASHLAARGFIIGEEISDNFYYHPDEQMTRGEFMLFLLSIVNKDNSAKPANIVFDDEENISDWLLKDAKIAYKLKIISGVGEGEKVSLYPNKKITRAEAFTMINNALKAKMTVSDSKDDLNYADKNMIPVWASQAIKNLTGYKIIQGGNGNKLNTSGIVTRGQAAELCYKLLKQIESSALTPSGDVK